MEVKEVKEGKNHISHIHNKLDLPLIQRSHHYESCDLVLHLYTAILSIHTKLYPNSSLRLMYLNQYLDHTGIYWHSTRKYHTFYIHHKSQQKSNDFQCIEEVVMEMVDEVFPNAKLYS